ncbi:MAG: class I SAM-dependent methyltransferase [Betaproteobacteria bacterium]|nr:class I SAM-dependent methyltransferase [Betaproteobacteria bacterium]
MVAKNATTRFSSRVDDYIKYRPNYPIEIIDLLAEKCGLTPESVIADIGSGTGILTKLFLENGNPVAGVEPNRDMREAGEHHLAEYARFTSVEGASEATRLPANSMDFVVAGQAFHWFDQPKARLEFQRILKEPGWVSLIWNDRRTDSTPFLRDYEALLQEFGTDYNEINHKNVQDKAVFAAFFGAPPLEAAFDNVQRFDLDGLMGRLNSSSYVPGRDDPRHAAMARRAQEIFAAHQKNGSIAFEYDTRVFYGEME